MRGYQLIKSDVLKYRNLMRCNAASHDYLMQQLKVSYQARKVMRAK